MRRPLLTPLVLLLAAAHAIAADPDSQAVTTKIESVGLFKNGLALIERTVELPGSGAFRIEDMPMPVHGTFFIESATAITTRATTLLVDTPIDLLKGALQEQLAGHAVQITVREKDAPIEGTVATIDTNAPGWNRRYEAPTPYWTVDSYGNRVAAAPGAGRFIVLDTRDGQALVEQGSITSIKVVGAAKTAKQRKPVLILKTIDNAPKQTIRISYLTKGIAWAPSYRVDLLDDKKLTISQNAVLKNELMAMKDVEVFLISGYPSIDFSHVDSPLSLTQNWAAFFQQLSARPSERGGGGRVVMQQAVMMNSMNHAGEGGGGPIAPPDESIDVHYESIGRQTLEEGDALALDVAGAETGYERVIEWTIPDARNEYGVFYDEYRRRENAADFDDSAWDAVKFKNPLPFAMTTAPATFTRDGRFMGQQISRWVNRNEETTLRITKALSIRTRASEQEDANANREEVFVGGRRYRKVNAKGELTVKNFRKTDAVIVIKRQFSGDLVNADEKPDITLREEGMWSVNRRSEMKWTITLKAGEEKTLKYAYTLLSSN